MSMNRRTLLQGAGSAAALALTLPISGQAYAASAIKGSVASRSTGQVPGIYRSKIGQMEITAILDGGMEFALELFPNLPLDAVEAIEKKAFVAPGPIKAYVNTFVVRTAAGKLVLIDTGAGGMAPTTGKLLQNLKAAGYNPEDFSAIYLTHAHIDHVSGLIDKTGKAVFSNASIRLCDVELQYWFDDGTKAKAPQGAQMLFDAARQCLGPYRKSGHIETFKAGDDLGSGISAVNLAGHTPGHCGFRLSDGAEQLLIWGDIVHAPVLQFSHPEYSIAFDVDAAKALETRNKILAEIAADRVRIAGMHLGFPGLGHVAKATTGYDFVPQVWEIF